MIGKRKVDVVHIELVKDSSVVYGESDIRKAKITKPEEAVRLASSFFKGADREKVYVCTLNANMQPINISMVSMGGMSDCQIHIAEIFKTAILSNCSNIICLHNHPSGCVEPSYEDRLATLKMQYVGRMLGIKLQDHIIVGDEGQYYSFQKEGIIANGEWVMDTEEQMAS